MKLEIAKKIIQKTISDYSKIAADFDRTRSKYAWPILREFAQYVKSEDNVLDFGCGNGRLLDVISAENVVYKGVDPVRELIDIARQKYQDVTAFDQSARGLAAKIKRSIEFETIDFNTDNFKLDFPDKYFDEIFAIAVFHHIPSDKLRQDVLRELKRVLKDDGRIFLTVWNLWTSHYDLALHKSQKSRYARFSLRKIFVVSKATTQIFLAPKLRISLIFADFLVRFHNVMSIWKGKGLRGAIRFFFAKIFAIIKDVSVDNISLKELDFGDLFIDYETADKKIEVQRYHHAFTKWGMKKLAESAGLKIEKVFYDEKKFNLCATLKK